MPFANVMRKNPERKPPVVRIGKAASAVLVLSALAVLVGCQGFSQSTSGGPQSGNLILGSAGANRPVGLRGTTWWGRLCAPRETPWRASTVALLQAIARRDPATLAALQVDLDVVGFPSREQPQTSS
jgi:hypothetical protein